MKRMSGIFLTVLILLLFSGFSIAQITSNPAGGLWKDATTWQGGTVPGQADDVIINAHVQINQPAVCNNITVTEDGKVNVTSNGQTHSLTVYGNLTNEGIIIDNDDDWFNMNLYVYGNITNSSLIKVNQLFMMDSGDQTITSLDGNELTVYTFINDNALTDVFFNGPTVANFYTVTFNSSSMIFSSDDIHTLGNYHDSGYNYIQNVVLDVSQGEVHFKDSWLNAGNVTIQDGYITGICNINGGNTLDNIIVGGTLQAAGNGLTQWITVKSLFANFGTIQNGNDRKLHIYLECDFSNYGTVENDHWYFKSGFDVELDTDTSGTFSPTYVTFQDSTSNVHFKTDFEFYDMITVHGNHATPTYASGTTFTLSSSRVQNFRAEPGENVTIHIKDNTEFWDGKITGLHSTASVNFENGAYFQNSILKDITINGAARMLWHNTLAGNTILEGTLERHSLSGSCNLTTTGSFVNNGQILKINTYNLYVNGNFENNGTVIAHDMYLNGTGTQLLKGTENSLWEVGSLYNPDTNSVIQVDGYLNFKDANISFNGQRIIMLPGAVINHSGMHKRFTGANLYANGGKVKVFNTGYAQNCTFHDAELLGKFYIQDGIHLRGNTVLTDTIAAYGFSRTFTTYDNFTNNGLVMKEVNNDLTMDVHGNVNNYGVMEHGYTYFYGSADQVFNIYDDSFPTGRVTLVGDENISPMQWYHDNNALSGANGWHYNIDGISATNYGDYHLVYNNIMGRTITIQDGNGGSAVQIEFDVNEGWNLISVPVAAEDMTTAAVFPSATGSAFAFNNGYVVTPELMNGAGYWLKFPAGETVMVEGELTNLTEIPVTEGWNIIGGYDDFFMTQFMTTEPAGLLASQFFAFNNAYTVSSEIIPGKGYWIKSSGEGVIKLNNPKKSAQVSTCNAISEVVFTDSDGNSASLKLANDFTDIEAALPPSPPAGVFDVRFANDKSIAKSTSVNSVILSSLTYPVSISASGEAITIRTEHGTQVVEAGSSITLSKEPASLSVQSNIVPVEYTLKQNYPNPFNPATTIEYSVTEQSKVTLEVMNILGERVALLVNKTHEAGNYSIRFNGTDLPSGMYLYRITTENFTSTKKMMLLK